MTKWALVICAAAIAAGTGSAGDHGAEAVKPGERSFHVLKALPIDADAYQGPAADLVRMGVPKQYGAEEWAAVVLTHELHQHVGIMTTIGAKMAVRARELLEAPPRAVKVVSETGPKPPFSCAVDGLQAGLASTYAQQLIEAPEVDEPRLAATFTYEDRTLRLALRPEFQKQVRGCIRSAIQKHGNLTPEYFEDIEAFSYVVWEAFDRHEIFVEEFLEQGKN